MDLFTFLFVNELHYTPELFQVKSLTQEQLACILQTMIWNLEEKEDWTGDTFNEGSREVAQIFGVNHKKVVMAVLFAAVTGKRQGPPLFASSEILGKDRLRARLLRAIQFLGGLSNNKMQQLQKSWEARDCSSWMGA